MTINAKVLKQREKIKKALAKISSIQEECTHIGVHIKYGANTGNWCPSDNSYWIDWVCPHCEKRWTTDQNSEAHRLARELNAVKI